jgi:hypothetical protein
VRRSIACGSSETSRSFESARASCARAGAGLSPAVAARTSPFFAISSRRSTPGGGFVAVTRATVPSLPRSSRKRRASFRAAGLPFSSGSSCRMASRVSCWGLRRVFRAASSASSSAGAPAGRSSAEISARARRTPRRPAASRDPRPRSPVVRRRRRSLRPEQPERRRPKKAIGSSARRHGFGWRLSSKRRTSASLPRASPPPSPPRPPRKPHAPVIRMTAGASATAGSPLGERLARHALSPSAAQATRSLDHPIR